MTLEKIDTWELQKELDRRQAVTIDIEAIKDITQNYEMGLIYSFEAAQQIKVIVDKTIKQYKTL